MTLAMNFFKHLGANFSLARQICRELWSRPLYFDLIVEQIYQVGVRSAPLLIIVVTSVGMVMALQFGIGLEKFGGKLYIPKLVSVSIIRELGPAFAGLMMAARVGAGITSEIGSMKVTQQIDAIRALGTSPIKRIVIPRVIACLVALPLLTVLANTTGVFGGLIIGTFDLGLDPVYYYRKLLVAATISDYMSGFFKTIFFSFFISIPACYFGLNVKSGTRSVGLATTKAVVTACVLIVVGDYFLTKLFLLFE